MTKITNYVVKETQLKGTLGSTMKLSMCDQGRKGIYPNPFAEKLRYIHKIKSISYLYIVCFESL